MASEDKATGIPDDVASMWKTLDPAIRAALIASESKEAEDGKKGSSGGGAEGRRAKASDGPRMDDTTSKFIGGDSFIKRTANPQWIKVRSDVYDAVKDRRQQELDAKVPVDIEVTMPDGKTLTEDKVSSERGSRTKTVYLLVHYTFLIVFYSDNSYRRETSTKPGALHPLMSHAPYLVV